MESSKFEIFQEFCIAKNNLATEFLIDNILFELGLSIPFETKYSPIKQLLIDFLIVAENLLKFAIKFVNKENLEYDNFQQMFLSEFQSFKDLNIIKEKFINFFFFVIIANIEKIQILKSKKFSSLNSNELTDYKLNMQLTFSHQNMAFIDNDAKVLLQLFKDNETNFQIKDNQRNNIFEIDEKNLDNLITKLKEINNRIKI